MKHALSLLIVFSAALLLAVPAKAQTAGEILSNREAPIYYFGIDFTKTKLIGDASANTQDIVDRQFAGINDLVVNEPKKYDLAGAFRKDQINSDLGFVLKRNNKISPDNIISTSTEDFNKLTEADVKSLIKGFETGDKKGTGLLIIAEGMSKPQKAVSAWVTLFDTKTKNVLLTERVQGSIGRFGGFTFRNYWASGFADLIDNIKKKKYKEWTSK